MGAGRNRVKELRFATMVHGEASSCSEQKVLLLNHCKSCPADLLPKKQRMETCFGGKQNENKFLGIQVLVHTHEYAEYAPTL